MAELQLVIMKRDKCLDLIYKNSKSFLRVKLSFGMLGLTS